MKHKLFLDDIRTPRITYNYVVVRSFEEFVKVIESEGVESFDFITFDHDLGDKSIPEKTGYDCLKYLIGVCLSKDIEFLPQINVHSENTVGTENIMSYANSFYEFKKDKKRCTRYKIILE